MFSYSLAHGETMPVDHKIEDVPLICQYPELPTGCEVTTLTMLLRYNGLSLNKLEVAKDMPQTNLPQLRDGVLVGESPSTAFIGDPTTDYSFGVFHEPMLSMIDDYFPGQGQNLTGHSFEDVLLTVAKDQPVMAWASIGMLPLTYTVGWQLQDNTTFQWPGNEHAVLITGYTTNDIIVNDPYSGKKRKYNRSLFEKRWLQMGQQAITIGPKTDDFTMGYHPLRQKSYDTMDYKNLPFEQRYIYWEDDKHWNHPKKQVHDKPSKEETIYEEEIFQSAYGEELNTLLTKGQTSSTHYYETVIRFQAEHNITVDGIVGSQTRSLLEEPSKIDHLQDQLPQIPGNKEWFIVVNKTKHILTVYNNGNIHKKYPVAVGKPSTPTPDYRFYIMNKAINPAWGGMGGRYTPVAGGLPNNPLGTRWMGLSTETYRGYGIHGNSSPRSIGQEVSSGCIRMINQDAEDLYSYIPINTPVWVGTEDTLEQWGIQQDILLK